MKLENWKKEYQWFSGKASDVARQLAFAGIAVVWLFRLEGGHGFILPNELVPPIGAFCASLALDLIQYTAGTFIWGIFHRYHEERVMQGLEDGEGDLSADPTLTYPMIACFWLKVAGVICGYALLIKFLISRWS